MIEREYKCLSCGRMFNLSSRNGLSYYVTCSICGSRYSIEILPALGTINVYPGELHSKSSNYFRKKEEFVKAKDSTINSMHETKGVVFKRARTPEHAAVATKNNIASSEIQHIRIKIYKGAPIGNKLQSSLQRVSKDYPALGINPNDYDGFVQTVFPSRTTLNCTVRNNSYLSENKLIQKLMIINKHSSYSKRSLADGLDLAFFGSLKAGEFDVDEVRVIDGLQERPGDTQIRAEVFYDGPRHPNALFEIASGPAHIADFIGDRLSLWKEYLDWKYRLAEMRIKGVKYIAVIAKPEERKMEFLCYVPTREDLDALRKVLNRNEDGMSIFSNRYSSERWQFLLNKDERTSNILENGTPLLFQKVSRFYSLASFDAFEDWVDCRQYCAIYKDKGAQETSSLPNVIQEAMQRYPKAYACELTFELSERGLRKAEADIRLQGFVSQETEQKIYAEYYPEGFIATTQSGDFALINRFQRAIMDLQNGSCASQTLQEWLFDISKARKPVRVEKINQWQFEEELNEEQKHAVEKMLSAPDVCLVQGPPGTGKTTVIAEAVYQFVIRGKRVLITSQTNLAVDNALARLKKNPNVRAIRLGDPSKIDDSVRDITEDNVLRTFYHSILEDIERNYLEEWKRNDIVLADLQKDIENINQELEHIEVLKGKYRKARETLGAIQQELEVISKRRNSIQQSLNAHASERSNLLALEESVSPGTKIKNFFLSSETLVPIFRSIDSSVQTLSTFGTVLFLSKPNVDSISDPSTLNNANKALAYAIQSAKKLLGIYRRNNESESTQTEVNSVNALQQRYQVLSQQLMEGDNSVLVEWQAVGREIQSGLAMSDPATLLDNEKDLLSHDFLEQYKKCGDRSELIRQWLAPVEEVILSLLQTIQENCKRILAEYDAEEERQNKEKNDIESRHMVAQQMQDELAIEGKACKARLRALAESHGIVDENRVLEILRSRAEDLKIQDNRKIDRKKWEPFFLDLESWITGIPDYEQENGIFLNDFINGCNVVGVSCTEKSRTLTEKGFNDFDVVIVDEVSKATPPEILLSLVKGKKAILVGDHRQLPPLFNEHEKSYEEMIHSQGDAGDVVLTQEDFWKYKSMVTSSLFQEQYEKADPSIKHALLRQYRMHPDIMEIVNHFYDGRLVSGVDPDQANKAHNLSILGRLGNPIIVPSKHAYWIDTARLRSVDVYERNRPGSTSKNNILEAWAIVELLKKIDNAYSNRNKEKNAKKITVGIISFYFDQVKLISEKLQATKLYSIDWQVNTVDRFQGREREIILVSLVRNTRRGTDLGTGSHMAAYQRINVAFSRAQKLLIVFGSRIMCSGQSVDISEMETGERTTTSFVYREIIEELDRKACVVSADEFIPDLLCEEILEEIQR